MDYTGSGGAMSPDEAAMFGGFMLIITLGFVFFILAIQIAICYFMSNIYKKIPEQYRLMEPGMVWLLMIPCFNIVWIWFAFPKLSKSLQGYFNDKGDTSVGNCGETLAWVYCGLIVSCVIPYLNSLTGIAALVVMIIFLVKTNELANRIEMDTQTTA